MRKQQQTKPVVEFQIRKVDRLLLKTMAKTNRRTCKMAGGKAPYFLPMRWASLRRYTKHCRQDNPSHLVS
jgi:hypothetical protein